MIPGQIQDSSLSSPSLEIESITRECCWLDERLTELDAAGRVSVIGTEPIQAMVTRGDAFHFLAQTNTNPDWSRIGGGAVITISGKNRDQIQIDEPVHGDGETERS